MDRENFYVLLELSLDPPEEDQEAIDEAIRKFQAKWSRFRNHPTKSIQAKKYIGMLAEMRRVMADPALREQEVKGATKHLAEKAEEKFVGVDRHLAIHLSKGYVTDEEVAKLAQLHGVAEEDIRNRIKQKEEEKFAEIDKQLSVRTAKGYVTEKELAKMAKKHSVSEELIRKRVSVPVTKEGENKVPTGQGLDRAILKVIEDNLSIVSKINLYEFLGVEPNSSLKLLQKKAHLREAEILKIGKKDATVTAGASLAGHCIAIFKSEETRAAYDISLARRHLRGLDSDIEVAGMDGAIRAEYFETLVEQAKQLGMDGDEARDYIKIYADSKNIEIEFKEDPKAARSTKKLFFAGGIVLVLLLALGGGGAWWLRGKSQEKGYVALQNQVNATKDFDKKINIISQYISSAPSEKYTAQAGALKKEIQTQMQQQEYIGIKKQVADYSAGRNYEPAVVLLEEFSKKYPRSKLNGSIEKQLAELSQEIEQRDFEALNQLVGQPVEDRMNGYLRFLKKHPKGDNAEEAKKTVWDMSEEYYIYIKKEIDKLAAQEKWAEAIRLCRRYDNIYDNRRAVELEGLAQKYTVNLREYLNFDLLVKKAEAFGDNWDAAKQVYLDFEQAYPNTSVQNKIEIKLAELDAKKENARQQRAMGDMGRKVMNADDTLRVNNNGTFTDTKTGLTWMLLDSETSLSRCLNYGEAKKYLSGLRLAGYTDWRLPTQEELQGLYKTKPFFPSDKETFYWTSKSYRAYSDGWVDMVRVVSSIPETTKKDENRPSYQCGSVRAVRP